jgi:HSP20 family protein
MARTTKKDVSAKKTAQPKKPARKRAVVRKASGPETPAEAAQRLPAAWDHPESLLSRLAQMRSDMDSLFDSITRGLGFPRFSFPRLEMPAFAGIGIADVRFEVSESDKAFEVVAELPGLADKDVDVALANGVLTVSGEKQDTREEKNMDYSVSERRYGSFMRSFRIPEGVDQDKVTSRFEKGVLTLTLPKSAAAPTQRPRKIEIGKQG